MALTLTQLLAAQNSASGTGPGAGTGYTTASFTPANNSLLVVILGPDSNSGSNTNVTTTITITDSLGTHLIYTLQKAQSANTAFDSGLMIWTAPVVTGALMTLTFTSTINMGTYGVWVGYALGFDTGTPVSATGGTAKSSGILNPEPGTFTLSGAPTVNDIVLAASNNNQASNSTPGSGWTELADVANTSWANLEVQTITGTTSTTVQWTNLFATTAGRFSFGAAAIVIKAASGGPTSVAATDAFTTADAVTRNVALHVAATDGFTTADAVTRTDALHTTATDAFTTADAVARTVALHETATDAWTTADSVARTEALNTAAGDSFTTADATARTVALHTAASDGWTTAEIVARVLTLHITATDGWTTTDAGSAVKTQSIAAVDAFATADSVARTLAVNAAGVDAFTTADTVTVRKALQALAADGWISADVVSRLVILGRHVADGWQTTDVATTQEPLGFLAVWIAGPVTVPWLTPHAVLTPWKTGAVTTDWITGRVSVTAISALSRQLVQVPVTELVSGLPVDPTALPVWVAFKLGRQQPTASDWLTGSWSTSSVNGQYLAQILVGPVGGLIQLTPGIWTVWLKIEADPEQPIIQVDSLTVY